MTEHEHAEVSRQLALAIGWKPEQFFTEHDGSYCAIVLSKDWITRYKMFDYRDPLVIWKIAERFNCFPSMWDDAGQKAWTAWCEPVDEVSYADTAALAVARAVIAAKEKA